MSDLPLPMFYKQVLSSLLPIFDDTASVSAVSSQAVLRQAIDHLYLIQRMSNSLALFSENESLNELGEKELCFMSVGWVWGACEEKGGMGGVDERMQALDRAEKAYSAFMALLESYGVVAHHDSSTARSTPAGGPVQNGAETRREVKMKLYKMEKELRANITSSLPDHPDPSSSPVVFLLSILSHLYPLAGPTEVPELLRPAILESLSLLHVLTISSLASLAAEREILSSAPASRPSHSSTGDQRLTQRSIGKDEWRLDLLPMERTKQRKLISDDGKVLRPFTILPSTVTLSDREHVKAQVFKESWRLPTMTIDEYLEEEGKRGNIISGGGQESFDAPTASELLQLAAEQDGTTLGDTKAEQQRMKFEEWAQYTETNQKGAGNTTNRG